MESRLGPSPAQVGTFGAGATSHVHVRKAALAIAGASLGCQGEEHQHGGEDVDDGGSHG